MSVGVARARTLNNTNTTNQRKLEGWFSVCVCVFSVYARADHGKPDRH